MRVGIVGVGFVGKATGEILAKHHDVYLYDKFKKEMNNPSGLKNCEILLLCLPTPMKPSGEMELSAVHDSMNLLEKIFEGTPKDNRPLIFLKSTAVPGTTNSLANRYNFHFGFNPEFLRERSAREDMKNTFRVVIGANRKEDHEKMHLMYKEAFPNASYVFVDTRTAEMIKYAANVMLMGQISIANELYQICDKLGINYNTIKEAILIDDRIGKNINVPGPDGELGFGGKCFPKDLNALIYLARENKHRPYLLEEMWRMNEMLRKNKDWLTIPGATTDVGFENTKNKNIPVSGVPSSTEQNKETENKEKKTTLH